MDNGTAGRETQALVKRTIDAQSLSVIMVNDSGSNPLDTSAVKPESDPVVQAMADDLGCSVFNLTNEAGLHKKNDLNRYATETIGLPPLTDILDELAKSGRNHREPFEHFSFDENISTIQDLEPDMRLSGIVANVTNFGAFRKASDRSPCRSTAGNPIRTPRLSAPF